MHRLLNMKTGLTEADERQINKELIPMFIEKQQELKPQYEKIKTVGDELN